MPVPYAQHTHEGEYHEVVSDRSIFVNNGVVGYVSYNVRDEVLTVYRKKNRKSQIRASMGLPHAGLLPPYEYHRLISINDQNQGAVVHEYKDDLLSKGPAQDDYWGCLYERPLFKIQWPLIDKNSFSKEELHSDSNGSEYAVLITGDGNGPSTGGQGTSASDSLYINVIDHGGDLVVKAPMLNVSYDSYPLIDYELKDDYFFTDAGIPKGSNREDLIAKDSKDPTAGRKGYGKLFGQDFNDNGQQDLVFWHRIYKSHKAVKDPKTKEWDTSKRRFEFEREWFTWYEENKERTSFIKRELSVEQGKKWLSDNQQGWNDGYPKDNTQCKHSGLHKVPMMTNVYDPELKPYQR